MENKMSKTIEEHQKWMNHVGGYARDMTMLDYFAARALPHALRVCGEEGAAERAYLIAETMIKTKDWYDD
jgi:hypothetical protein